MNKHILIRSTIIVLLFIAKVLNAQSGYHQVPKWLYFDKVMAAPNGKTVTLATDTNSSKFTFAKWNTNLSLQFALQCSGSVGGGFKEISNSSQGSHFITSKGKIGALSVAWVSRIDDNGNVLWQKYIKDSTGGNPIGIVKSCPSVGSDKSLLLSFQIMGMDMIAKLDSNGNIAWQNLVSCGGANNIDVMGLEQVGNSYVLATSCSNNIIALCKIDAAGTVQATNSFKYVSDSSAFVEKICHLPTTGNYAILINNNNTQLKSKSVAFVDSNFNIINVVKLSTNLDQYMIKEMTASEDGSNVLVFGDLYKKGTGVYSDFHLSIAKLSSTSMLWHTEARSVNLWNSYSILGATSGFERNGLIYYGTSGSMDYACLGTLDNLGNGFCQPLSKNLTHNLYFPTVANTVTSLTPFTMLSAVNASETITPVAININTLCGNMPNAINKNAVLDNNLIVAPNPVFGTLQFANSNKIMLQQINVYNISGACVLASKAFHNTIDISTLQSGVYFYEAKADNGIRYRGKFIAQ